MRERAPGGRIVLAGSGEFSPAMAGLDLALLGGFDHSARVAIVPAASVTEEEAGERAETGAAHFRALGADPFAIMVRTREDAADARHAAALVDADWIYLSGGDPAPALAALADTPFWRAIVARHSAGAIVAGSSAGAMILGECTIVPIDRAPGTLIPRDVAIRPGLGLLPGILVFPHFDAIPEPIVARWQHLWPAGLRLLALDEDTAIVSDEDGWAVHGTGRALILGDPETRRAFAAGMTIPASFLPLR